MATFSAVSAGNPFVQAGNMNASDPWGSYNSAYGAAAATNNNLYQQAMAGYAQMIAQANAAQQANNRGWVGLQRQVVRGLRGSNRANIQDIADKYTALSGQFSQQMIDRGLGNTTVQQSMQRGVTADWMKERTRSQGEYAQRIADAQTRIGSSRLDAQQRGIGMMSGIQGDQMRYLAAIQAPYPDPGMYAAMASQMSGGGGGAYGMGMAGPSPGVGPIGGYAPRYGGGAPLDFQGGGTYSEGFGGWATGYGGPPTGAGYDQLAMMNGGGGYSFGGGGANMNNGMQSSVDVGMDYSNLG